MLQFYFLSIFFNLFTGFVLFNEKKTVIELPFLKERVFRIVLGVLTAFIGIIKLFVVVNTNVVILGDLIPSIAGIAGGIALFIESDDKKYPQWFNQVFITNKYIVGIACLAAALLHFVFPGAMFL